MVSWFLFAVGFSVLIPLNGLGVDVYETLISIYRFTVNPYLPYDELTSQAPVQLLGLKWSNCNNQTKKAVTLTSLSVKPDIFRIGGNITISGAINVSQDVGVSGEVLTGDMALKMKVGTGYMDLCSLVGPNICHKPDMCGFLRTVSKECPTIVKAQGNNCTCPIKKNVYGIKDWTIVLDNMQFKMAGSFNFSFSLKDKVKELACFDLRFCINKCN